MISLKDSIKWIERIKKKLTNHYDEIFKLIEVIPPMFIEEDSDMVADLSPVSREVTIDLGDSYKVARLLQSHTNFGRDLINKIKLDEDEGVKFLGSTIWRDLPESPKSTTVRQELTFQIRINNEIEFEPYLKDLTQDAYSVIYSLLGEIQKEAGINHQYPRKVGFISSQQLENELPNMSFRERERETVIEEEAYVLVNAGKTLHSGKVHTFITPELYDLNNFYQIVLKDRVNSDTIKVASIALLSSGQQLADQLSLYDMSNLKSTQFYKDLIGNENKIVEIRFNLPRLAMAVLAKGHIAEVQAGIISDESNTLKQRYKLEKY